MPKQYPLKTQLFRYLKEDQNFILRKDLFVSLEAEMSFSA